MTERFDTATLEFLELVDCKPADVRDIPLERRGIDAVAEARNSEGRVSGTYTLPFGKHRGKPLDDVPRDYLHWLIAQPSDGAFRRTARVKSKVAIYLEGSGA